MSRYFGCWGVFKAIGGYLPNTLTAENLHDLVFVFRPIGEREALKAGRMPLTEAQTMQMAAAVCERLNTGK